MQGNDISNEVAPKLFFIVEDLIATISEEHQRTAEKAIRRSQWKKLASCYDFDGKMIAHLWDLIWRTNYSFSLITLASSSEEWFESLEARLDRFNVPYSGLMGFKNVEELARHVVYIPNALRIYHGNEDWRFTFGHLGEYVSDATTFQVR